MIRTLGHLEYEKLNYRRYVPLLIATYIAHSKHPVPREQLAQLFWPHASSDGNVSSQLTNVCQHLYERFEATNQHIIVFDYIHLCDVIAIEPFADFPYVIEQLRPLHKKLKKHGFISKYSYNLDHKGITVSYTITENLKPMKMYNHDKAKHNLRVALCNLRKMFKIEATQYGRLQTDVTTDYQLCLEALKQGELDSALSLYQGHFLVNIEDLLYTYSYELGTELANWIVSERQNLAWAIQRALLKKAHQAKADTSYTLMGQYARRAVTLYNPCPTEVFVDDCAELIDLSEEKHASALTLKDSLTQLPPVRVTRSIKATINPNNKI